MDLVGYSRETFDAIEVSYREFAKQIGIDKIQAIPVSAVHGDNVVEPSANMTWYNGPTLMHFLETVPTEHDDLTKPFRMPVQWVNRPNHDFRGFAGTIVSGVVRPGDRVRVLPSGRESEVARIVTSDGDLPIAIEGQSIAITLKDEIDVSRGDVISAAAMPPQVADQFEATLIWMHDEPMLPGRKYTMKMGVRTVAATVAPLKYRVNVNSLEHIAAEKLELNDIGVVEMELDQPVVFQPYKENRALGGFILMDRLTNNTVGAGLLHFALRRAENVHWQALDVTQKVRARQKKQEPCLLWFTGLSGAGKSTIANLVEKRLVSVGRHTYLLDGDNVRHGLNKDLGFTAQDRVENIRRVGEVAKLMVDAGLIVLASFISPFRSERRMVRDLFKTAEFVEVFVDTPLDVAEQRDPKGLYKKARRGELRNFTGIDSPYESPEQPEIRIDTTVMSAQQAADEIIEQLLRRGVLEKSRVLQPQ
jgi:bifunctional enzyme CysN/CysC